jgi:sigma-E factor negative regulatory protein RseC
MIVMSAVVVQVSGSEAVVAPSQGGGCGSCSSSNSCGSSKITQFITGAPRQFRVQNDVGAQVGMVVQIGLPEGVLLQSAMLVYILPLVLLLIGAIVGDQLSSETQLGELYSALLGGIGLSMGFVLVKVISLWGRYAAAAQPVVLSTSV